MESSSIRILLSIAVFRGYKVWQIGVKNVFLQNTLKKIIFISQPHDYINKEFSNHVGKLNKEINVLK